MSSHVLRICNCVCFCVRVCACVFERSFLLPTPRSFIYFFLKFRPTDRPWKTRWHRIRLQPCILTPALATLISVSSLFRFWPKTFFFFFFLNFKKKSRKRKCMYVVNVPPFRVSLFNFFLTRHGCHCEWRRRQIYRRGFWLPKREELPYRRVEAH